MQVTKPQALSLSTRPIEYRKRFGLCVTGCLHVPFTQEKHGSLWGEQSMWNFLSKEMVTPLIDEGVAKLTPEFLVHGNAYSTVERPNAGAARVRLGDKEKTILVFGDRYWDGGRVTAPKSFKSMPIEWQRAYGGKDFDANPLGKGRGETEGVNWLPNLELAHSRILKPNQTVMPAGFGQLDVMHPQRKKYQGTYDASYLKEHSPGFVPDMDWRYFNMAPEDQWMDKPLRGDEPFLLENLHPTQSRIDGKLPGLRARVFASYGLAAGGTKLKEIPLRLTTVWFFPHAERFILLFQGLAEVGTDDGSDVVGLLGAVERLGQTKSDEHYRKVLDLRSDAKMGGIHSLRDSDLLPDDIDICDPDLEEAKKAFATDSLQANAQFLRAQTEVAMAREQVRSMGEDPDAMGIKMPIREQPPTGDKLAAYMEKQLKEAEKQQWNALEDVLDQMEKALTFATEHKIDLAQLQHRGPPLYNAETQLQLLQESNQAVAKDGSTVYAKLIKIEGAEKLGYLQAAHEQPKVPPMTKAQSASIRAEMVLASSKGFRYFEGLNFTGADLSELDLRGCNFAGAWLESVNFSKSNLSGADFSYAVLAHANFTDAIAVGGKFAGANLGRATLTGAIFDDTMLENATLMYCNFAQTHLRRAKLSHAQLLNTSWGKADWTGVIATGQTFYKLDLQGVVLAEANLAGCTFVECNLCSLDLRGANLQGSTFVTCKLDKALIQSAAAKGTVFVKGCTLISADFSQADFGGCNFGESDMTGIRMVKTVLDGANLSKAKVSDSDWRLSSAKGTLMRKTNMRGALLAGVNFQDAILHHADLRGADMRNCNLFAADMSRVKLDGDVKFDGALLKRARTWPRLTLEQQAISP